MPTTADDVEICVLLYGDHFDLAKRCIDSIRRNTSSEESHLVRVGMNACCVETRRYVRNCFPERQIWESEENICKYPLMRRMFYDPKRPIISPHVCWFDDDSYVKNEPGSREWLDDVRMQLGEADLIGSIYTMPFQGSQRDWIKAQPWYAGNDPYQRRSYRFVTGGWWAARMNVIRRYNYPWPELTHNGGDVALGELCLQQGLVMVNHRSHIAINADENGGESKAKRRGESRKPLGFYPHEVVPVTMTPPEYPDDDAEFPSIIEL